MKSSAFPWVGTVVLVALVGCGGHGTNASAAEGDSSVAGGNIAGAAGNTTENSGSVDACQLLTKDDATAFFGQPASSQVPEMAPLPDQIGVCQWGWVGAEQAQQVALKVMTSPGNHYFEIDGAQALQLGDKGQLVIDETTLSMDVDWVQNGKFFDLHYFASPFDAFDKGKAGPLESLAREISGRL